MALSPVVSMPFSWQDSHGQQRSLVVDWDVHFAKSHDDDVGQCAAKVGKAHSLSATMTSCLEASILSNLHTFALNHIRAQGKDIVSYNNMLPGPTPAFPEGTIGAPNVAHTTSGSTGRVQLPSYRPTAGYGLYGAPKSVTYPGKDKPIISGGYVDSGAAIAPLTSGRKRKKQTASTPAGRGRGDTSKTPKSGKKIRLFVPDTPAVATAAAVVDDGNFDICARCKTSGDLICCDRCPYSYHPDCAQLREIPTGDWFCPPCTLDRTRLAGLTDHNESTPAVERIYNGPFRGSGAGPDAIISIVQTLLQHEFLASNADETTGAIRSLAALNKRLHEIRENLHAATYLKEGGDFDTVRAVADVRLALFRALTEAKAGTAAWRMTDVLWSSFEGHLRDTVALTEAEAIALRGFATEELVPPRLTLSSRTTRKLAVDKD